MAYDKSGISKEKDVKEKYNKDKAGGFFKYYELETLEDIFQNFLDLQEECSLNEEGCLYIIKDINFWMKVDYVNILYKINIIKPNYDKDKIEFNTKNIYTNKTVDLPETISNLLGFYILKIQRKHFTLNNQESIYIDNMDISLLKPLLGVWHV